MTTAVIETTEDIDMNGAPKKLADLIFATKAAGWKVETSSVGETFSMAARSPDQTQIVSIFYQSGTYVESWVEFPDQQRRVYLKNASAVRKQVVEPLDSKPVKVFVKSGGGARVNEQPVSEAPFDTAELLPFQLDDSNHTIREALAGKRIVWRNTEMNRVEAARLPEDFRLLVHPRMRRRMVVWTDSLGTASVMLDRIRRVLP